jgi:hypothetical protein
MLRADQIGVEEQLAHLTAEQQPFVWTVVLRGVPTARAGLTGLAGVGVQFELGGEDSAHAASRPYVQELGKVVC